MRTVIFLLGLFLLFTLYTTGMAVAEDPRWDQFPSECAPIQRFSCARVAGAFGTTYDDCTTCSYRTQAITADLPVDVSQTVSYEDLQKTIKKCIPAFYHHQ